jgi:hypothetical protein
VTAVVSVFTSQWLKHVTLIKSNVFLASVMENGHKLPVSYRRYEQYGGNLSPFFHSNLLEIYLKWPAVSQQRPLKI